MPRNPSGAHAMGRGIMCCVPGCNEYFYDKENVLSGVHFFRIPNHVLSDKKLKERWCAKIKRQDGRDGFIISDTTRICQKHFKDSEIKVSLVTKKWTLEKDAEPSIFNWVSTTPRKPPKARPLGTRNDLAMNDDFNLTFSNSEEVHSESGVHVSCQAVREMRDQACQTGEDEEGVTSAELEYHDHVYTVPSLSDTELLAKEVELNIVKLNRLKNKIVELEAIIKDYEENEFTLDKIATDKQAMLFYTGFPSIETFNAVYKYLESKSGKLNYWRGRNESTEMNEGETDTGQKRGRKRTLSSKDELFMVLVRLKVGLFVRDVASRFRISQGHFSKIFTTWINFLALELPLLFPFPSQSLIRKNMPLEFAEYPTTRIVIDCTEIYIEVPSTMGTQSQTWSSYKHHNTWKIIVGISPNGPVTFISDSWGGNVSDKEITKKSGILDLLEESDNVMADRGFEIEDILPKGVQLNIPPFLKGRSQLTASEVEETMKIASVRINVERQIGRIKNYHILDGVMPLSLAHVAPHIVKVIGYLTNVLPPLFPPGQKVQSNDK